MAFLVIPPVMIDRLRIAGTLAILTLPLTLQAQMIPDSGQILRELDTPPIRNIQPGQDLDISTPQFTIAEPGGVTTTVKKITLVGNTVFSSETLHAVLGEAEGQTFDLAGLQQLAARITAYYQQHDYAFTMAYLPPQNLQGGQLTIGVVEGRYGDVSLMGDDALTAGLEKFVSNLQTGEMIESQQLSRATRVLNRLPGMTVTSVLRPGQNTGEGDLSIDVNSGTRIQTAIGTDNYGNRYSGQMRTMANIKINRALMVGDELAIDAMVTDESLWYGGLRYQFALNGSGLRAAIEYLQTHYELGEELTALGAEGDAKITKLGLRYPLILQRDSELNLSVDLLHSDLDDRYNSSLPTYSKSSDALSLQLNGYRFNQLGQGGLTQGQVSLLGGELKLDDELIPSDAVTANTDGGYTLLQLEVSHEQKLANNFTLFTYLDTQWTEDNLDSSEGFGLGGASGVRAYPSGEAYGDRGWLGQIELRYQWQQLAPYLFYDLGEVTVNAEPWESSDNHRRLAGAGAGMRLSYKQMNIDASAAWRTLGGDPQSDTEYHTPTFWVRINYDFF